MWFSHVLQLSTRCTWRAFPRISASSAAYGAVWAGWLAVFMGYSEVFVSPVFVGHQRDEHEDLFLVLRMLGVLLRASGNKCVVWHHHLVDARKDSSPILIGVIDFVSSGKRWCVVVLKIHYNVWQQLPSSIHQLLAQCHWPHTTPNFVCHLKLCQVFFIHKVQGTFCLGGTRWIRV